MLGRIGCRGQHKVHVFEHEDEAVELYLELLSEKRKRAIARAQAVETQGIRRGLLRQHNDIAPIGCHSFRH